MTQQTTINRMSTRDAEFFFVERDNAPMHLRSLAVFEGPAPAHLDVVRLFEARLPRLPGTAQAWAKARSGWPRRRRVFSTVRSARAAAGPGPRRA